MNFCNHHKLSTGTVVLVTRLDHDTCEAMNLPSESMILSVSRRQAALSAVLDTNVSADRIPWFVASSLKLSLCDGEEIAKIIVAMDPCRHAS